eukprot:gene4621-3331_t
MLCRMSEPVDARVTSYYTRTASYTYYQDNIIFFVCFFDRFNIFLLSGELNIPPLFFVVVVVVVEMPVISAIHKAQPPEHVGHVKSAG